MRPAVLSMNAPSSRDKTPGKSIEEVRANCGMDAVVAGCLELLNGRNVDAELVLALDGPRARWVVTAEPPGPPYWLRVWALRGLLWASDDVALPSAKAALHDDAWRVREMAPKVVHRHRLENAVTRVADLMGDPVTRVRAAASRALVRLATSG